MFALSCAACALAPNLWFLIAARAFQGLTTGVIIANVMTALGLGVPEGLRARAYAANSSVWGAMGVGGPALAALILAVADWQATFWANLPVAAVAMTMGWRAFPELPEGSTTQRLDQRGLAHVVAFTLLCLAAVSSLSWWSLVALAIAAVVVAVYVAHERRIEPPVLRRRHLTTEPLRMLHINGFLTITSGLCINAFVPIYAKGARGLSTSQAAFTVVFFTVGWTGGAFVSSRISELRTRLLAIRICSLVLFVSACAAAGLVWTEAPLPLVFAAFVGIGAGLGGVSSAGLGEIQAHAVPSEMGRVNSAHQFVRTLGFSFGAGLGGAVLFSVVARRLGDADAARDVLGDDQSLVDRAASDAISAGFTLSAVLGAVLTLLAAIAAHRIRVPEPATAVS